MSELPLGFIAEGYARSTVPEQQLVGAHRIFFIVSGAMCGLPVFVLATDLVRGMGLGPARYAYWVGGLISGILGGLSAYTGARTRMNLAMLADQAFGSFGGRIVKTTIAFSLVGWIGVILSILGATATNSLWQLYGIRVDPAFIALGTSLAVTAVALRGVAGLQNLGTAVGPLLAGLLAWTFFKGCTSGILAPSLESAKGLDPGAAISPVIGAYIVGIVIQPDYGRFVRDPLRAGAAVGVALGIIYPAVLTLAAILAFRCSASDLIGAMVSIGIGLPALALIVLGAWNDASASLYSSSLTLTNEVKWFRLPWVTVGCAAAGCMLAILHAERQFLPWLDVLGVTFPPVAAINILNVFLDRDRGHSRDGDSDLPRVRWSGLSAWAAGSLVGYLTGHGSLRLSGITSIDSILVAGVVWWACHALDHRRSSAAT